MKEQPNIWKNFPGKLTKNQLLIFLLIGVLLFVVALPVKDEIDEKEGETELEEQLENRLEERLEGVLEEIAGVGKVKVMITLDEDENVKGVAVVCQGGDSSVTVQKITEVVEALFDVPVHKIKIMKGTQTE